ncbi:hypothetical protein BDW59DRAFT_158993 [Aspergillus cavernicola]|uniref:Uncharacterized protein n=1 Tax=Aspergillus cavernicola TaxID=176166 RepID=A0ABR4INR2_9EURO
MLLSWRYKQLSLPSHPVAVVVPIKIDKDPREQRRHQRLNSVQSEIGRPLIDYGDEITSSKNGIELDCDLRCRCLRPHPAFLRRVQAAAPGQIFDTMKKRLQEIRKSQTILPDLRTARRDICKELRAMEENSVVKD